MSTLWKFVNKTTGKEIETNDLKFLLHEIKEEGIILPPHVDVDMILRGRGEYTVLDDEGNTNKIVIGEHSPERGIYFSSEPVIN